MKFILNLHPHSGTNEVLWALKKMNVELKLVYGVMVTQLFLVQSFKVRVLVDQQEVLQILKDFFVF